MRKLLITAALAFVLAPGTARADWLLTPNVGGVFNGPATDSVTWGASFAWMGEGILGLEADLGFASDNLFDTDEADLLGIDRDFFDANVSTVFGNAIVGVPFGGSTGKGFSPFGVAGLGLLRTNVQTDNDLFDSTDNNLGLSLGGGAFGFVTDSIGFRGDIRWYYSITDPSLDFDLLDAGVVNRVDSVDLDLTGIDIDRDFWRATGGVTFRW